MLIAGCERTSSTIEHPGLPQHRLIIDGEVNFKSSISWDRRCEYLTIKIWAENTGENTAEVSTGSCSFNILAYTLDENSGKLVWNNRMPRNYVCHDELLVYTIEPDKSVLLEDIMYTNGKQWAHDLPKGKWQFVLQAKSENNRLIVIPSNRVVID